MKQPGPQELLLWERAVGQIVVMTTIMLKNLWQFELELTKRMESWGPTHWAELGSLLYASLLRAFEIWFPQAQSLLLSLSLLGLFRNWMEHTHHLGGKLSSAALYIGCQRCHMLRKKRRGYKLAVFPSWMRQNLSSFFVERRTCCPKGRDTLSRRAWKGTAWIKNRAATGWLRLYLCSKAGKLLDLIGKSTTVYFEASMLNY